MYRRQQTRRRRAGDVLLRNNFIVLFAYTIDKYEKTVYTMYTQIKELNNMITSIRKWGNSQGIRIPIQVLSAADFSIDDIVDVTANDGKIVLEKANKATRPTISELFADYDGDFAPSEFNWGLPEGNEIW